MARHLLNKLTPIEGGDIRRVLTRDRLNAIQDAILALWRGENITTTGSLKRSPGDAGIRLDGGARSTRGGGGSTVIPPLTIVASRPPYIPEPAALEAGKKRFYVTWGMTAGVLADNWNNCVDIPSAPNTTRYLSMKAFLTPTGDAPKVTNCLWVTFTQAQKDAGTFTTPDYGENGGRPAHMFVPLGMIMVDAEGQANILNEAGGSIHILEYVANISFGAEGTVRYKKGLSATRLVY